MTWPTPFSEVLASVDAERLRIELTPTGQIRVIGSVSPWLLRELRERRGEMVAHLRGSGGVCQSTRRKRRRPPAKAPTSVPGQANIRSDVSASRSGEPAAQASGVICPPTAADRACETSSGSSESSGPAPQAGSRADDLADDGHGERGRSSDSQGCGDQPPHAATGAETAEPASKPRPPRSPCYCCRGRHFWFRHGWSRWLCSRCRPPVPGTTESEITMLEGLRA